MAEVRMKEKIKPGERAKLVDALNSGDSEEACRALALFCPCRNRVYDREVWKAIFAARDSGLPGARDGAEHAIGTLRERAHTDPRSQKLLSELDEYLDEDLLDMAAIAEWGPR